MNNGGRSAWCVLCHCQSSGVTIHERAPLHNGLARIHVHTAEPRRAAPVFPRLVFVIDATLNPKSPRIVFRVDT